MADQWIILPKTSPTPLVSTRVTRPLVPGSSVSFVSTSYNPVPNHEVPIDGAGFNLVNGQDILLHISVRRAQNVINFNTRRGNTWGTGTSINLYGIFPGPGAVINVNVTAATYEISFNNNPARHTFRKAIQGDASAVSYFEDEHRAPTFSNPVVAAIFHRGAWHRSEESEVESTHAATDSADAASTA